MHLQGSCHCRKVRFSVDAAEPVPFMRCYCSICRKTAGGGGYAINLGANTHSMKVTGKRYLGIYRARVEDEGDRRPFASCHSFSDMSGYSSKRGSPAVPSTLTHAGFEPSMMWAFSGGCGSGVSIALACGCTSSGQRGSHTHSALPHLEQK